MSRPPPTAGMRHVALRVNNLEACERFYVELLGMRVEWRPDADSVYLSSGNDNVALHRATAPFAGAQHLDHIGFVLNDAAQVDEWYSFLSAHEVRMHTRPKSHRDGARSFYCFDPDDNMVQMIHHPPLAGQWENEP